MWSDSTSLFRSYMKIVSVHSNLRLNLERQVLQHSWRYLRLMIWSVRKSTRILDCCNRALPTWRVSASLEKAVPAQLVREITYMKRVLHWFRPNRRRASCVSFRCTCFRVLSLGGFADDHRLLWTSEGRQSVLQHRSWRRLDSAIGISIRAMH